MKPEEYSPSPLVADLYRRYPNPLATQAVEAVIQDLPPLSARASQRRWLVACLLVLRLPIRWFMLSLRSVLRRPRAFSPPAGYVLFLPNIGWNLPGMARVAAALPDRPRVYCCPNNLSPAQIRDSLDTETRCQVELFRFSWKHHVRFARLPAYIRFARHLTACHGGAAGPTRTLVKRIADAALYGVVCADLPDDAFTRVLSRPPAVIVSARPKSEYGNLPFLVQARRTGIPAYHLAHTHISRSAWFRYQVFQGGLFTGHFLFSHSCARIAREHFDVREELIVVGDPTVDDVAPSRPADGGEAGSLRVLYAASSDYGRQSMRDVTQVCAGLEGVILHIKARPPGNNTDTVYRFLEGCDLDGVSVLDHARVGRIEDILTEYDLVVGSVSNGILSALIRGVPAVSYIPGADWRGISERAMEPLPYAEFGVTVLRERNELADLVAGCRDPAFRDELYRTQRAKAEDIYPNLAGISAAAAIRTHLVAGRS